jgi:hypothetical protein
MNTTAKSNVIPTKQHGFASQKITYTVNKYCRENVKPDKEIFWNIRINFSLKYMYYSVIEDL